MLIEVVVREAQQYAVVVMIVAATASSVRIRNRKGMHAANDAATRTSASIHSNAPGLAHARVPDEQELEQVVVWFRLHSCHRVAPREQEQESRTAVRRWSARKTMTAAKERHPRAPPRIRSAVCRCVCCRGVGRPYTVWAHARDTPPSHGGQIECTVGRVVRTGAPTTLIN